MAYNIAEIGKKVKLLREAASFTRSLQTICRWIKV